MKIISYNINGIRAAMRKDIIGWLKKENPDIVCFQELKANCQQFDEEEFKILGYNCYWNSAQRPGYSGVALLSKNKPKDIYYGIGNKKYDIEGRVLYADFTNYIIVSVYMPSGTTGEIRQNYKMEFLKDFLLFTQDLLKKNKNIIISGDFNICHNSIDIHNPIANKYSSENAYCVMVLQHTSNGNRFNVNRTFPSSLPTDTTGIVSSSNPLLYISNSKNLAPAFVLSNCKILDVSLR